jgi:hypothetical protein
MFNLKLEFYLWNKLLLKYFHASNSEFFRWMCAIRNHIIIKPLGRVCPLVLLYSVGLSAITKIRYTILTFKYGLQNITIMIESII